MISQFSTITSEKREYHDISTEGKKAKNRQHPNQNQQRRETCTIRFLSSLFSLYSMIHWFQFRFFQCPWIFFYPPFFKTATRCQQQQVQQTSEPDPFKSSKTMQRDGSNNERGIPRQEQIITNETTNNGGGGGGAASGGVRRLRVATNSSIHE